MKFLNYFISHVLCYLQKPVCVAHIQHASGFTSYTLHVLNSHTWLVTTVLVRKREGGNVYKKL